MAFLGCIDPSAPARTIGGGVYPGSNSRKTTAPLLAGRNGRYRRVDGAGSFSGCNNAARSSSAIESPEPSSTVLR